MTGPVFRKAGATAPAGHFRWEAAGLRWLRVPSGARVADVLETADDHLDLRRMQPVAPGRRAAEERAPHWPGPTEPARWHTAPRRSAGKATASSARWPSRPPAAHTPDHLGGVLRRAAHPPDIEDGR
jgi:hypothetical protein